MGLGKSRPKNGVISNPSMFSAAWIMTSVLPAVGAAPRVRVSVLENDPQLPNALCTIDAEVIPRAAPPLAPLTVWSGHAPVMVILVPATREGVAVPVPPLVIGSRPVNVMLGVVPPEDAILPEP